LDKKLVLHHLALHGEINIKIFERGVIDRMLLVTLHPGVDEVTKRTV
jgi:hypothetical protein